MKRNRFSVVLALVLVCCFLMPMQVVAASIKQLGQEGNEYSASTPFAPPMGETTLALKHNFDFIQTDSSQKNWDLALTGVTLADRVYNDKDAEKLLSELGYDTVYTTQPFGSDQNQFIDQVASMGYKHFTGADGNAKNVFAIVIRGTSNPEKDIPTDLIDGAFTMFDTSRGNVVDWLKSFIEYYVKRSLDELKTEDTYFFLAGHSLGGAVANALSVDETIMSLCNNDKGRIYTYTFESPHTCINLWWEHVDTRSNAFNFKDIDDWVTHKPGYFGATTYGTDVVFSVNDLDNQVFKTLFPNAKGGSVTAAPAWSNYGNCFGHHDLGLDLVYVIQHGIAEGWWKQLYEKDGIISMWQIEEEKEKETTTKQSNTSSSTDNEANKSFLIGNWKTADDMTLTFNEDNTFRLEWGYFPTEEGEWRTKALTEQTFSIELDGSDVLSMMSMVYGNIRSDYHFEVLKCNDDNFYLVQVYDDYTAKSSPCKLGFTRDGATKDFSY